MGKVLVLEKPSRQTRFSLILVHCLLNGDPSINVEPTNVAMPFGDATYSESNCYSKLGDVGIVPVSLRQG
jgi:hypothetical protein